MKADKCELRLKLYPDLLASLRAGDAGASELLERHCRAALLRFCWRYLEDPQAAEDAVQEIFRKLLAARDIPDDPRAWLYRIARNHCTSIRREWARAAGRIWFGADRELVSKLTGMLSRLAREEQQSQLRHLVAALPENQQEVLRLRYTEGLSRAEIAYVLDIPETLVKSRLYEAMRKLRDHTSLLREG